VKTHACPPCAQIGVFFSITETTAKINGGIGQKTAGIFGKKSTVKSLFSHPSLVYNIF
jgi:hypothetical protein